MANDGGLLDEKASKPMAERILCQRVFFFNLLSRGISVTLLKGAEYHDSKVSCRRHRLI
jgi:ATP-dependent RNA helicase DDX60